MPAVHFPGYNYCGPGTHDFSRKPINKLDRACKKHDIGYTRRLRNSKGKRVSAYTHFNPADQELLEDIEPISGPYSSLVQTAFRAKRLLAPKAVEEDIEGDIMPPRKRVRNGTSSSSTIPQYYSRGRSSARVASRSYFRSSGRNIRTGGFLGIEKKFYDTFLIAGDIAGGTDATGGELDPSATLTLNTVAQGDGESNRDGRLLNMDSLEIHGTIHIPGSADATTPNTPPLVFVACVLDKQANGAKLNSEDVFCNVGANASTAAQPFRNLEYHSRFRILKSKVFTMKMPEMVHDGTQYDKSGQRTPFRWFINLKGMRVTYKNTTADIANITDNAISMVAFTSNVTGVDADLHYAARLRFTG